MYLDSVHSVQDPIAECQHSGEIPSKPKSSGPKAIRDTWWNLYQELSLVLIKHLKGPISQQIRSCWRVVHDACFEWLGVATSSGDRKEEKWPNRRQIQNGKLTREQRVVKSRLKESPLHKRADLKDLVKEIKENIFVISRAENQRKGRKKKRPSWR